MIHRSLAAFAAVALLAGCGTSQPGDGGAGSAPNEADVTVPADNVVDNGVAGNAAAPASAATLRLAGDGLSLLSGGGARQLSFNASRDATLAPITAAMGNPTDQGTNPECGEGPLDNVDWPGGIVLFFQNGKFVGWDVDGRDGSPYKTASGIGIGSTLQQLRDAGDVEVTDTSLGIEFRVGEISGLLTANRPDGKVTNLWSGMTCIFR